MNKKILVLDNTLRDGEQQPLINFNKKQKKILIKEIFKLGVDFIDLMPISNEQEKKLVKETKEYPLILSTPLTNKAINLSSSLKKDVVIFQAVSNRLLKQRYKKTLKESKKENIKKVKNKNKNIRIFVAGEDSSRAELKYLIKFIKSIEKEIDCFIFADSIGYLIPEKTEEIIKTLKKETKCKIGIHAHNDLGFADENTIQAVKSGADLISGTFTGIGERAGNANLGNVLRKLKKEKINLKQINYKNLKKVEKLVNKYAGIGPAKPLSKKAFFVETGIHVNALLHDSTGYSLIDPKILGFKHKVFFSKQSGISNLEWYFGKKYNKKEYQKFRDKIKKESLKKNKSFNLYQIKKILKIK